LSIFSLNTPTSVNAEISMAAKVSPAAPPESSIEGSDPESIPNTSVMRLKAYPLWEPCSLDVPNGSI